MPLPDFNDPNKHVGILEFNKEMRERLLNMSVKIGKILFDELPNETERLIVLQWTKEAMEEAYGMENFKVEKISMPKES